MNGSDLLHEAGVLVGRGWCQDAVARDASGGEVDACAPDAVEWSLLGALQAAAFGDSSTEITDIGVAVAAIAQLIADPSLPDWNDVPTRTRLDVVDLLARAEQIAARHIAAVERAVQN